LHLHHEQGHIAGKEKLTTDTGQKMTMRVADLASASNFFFFSISFARRFSTTGHSLGTTFTKGVRQVLRFGIRAAASARKAYAQATSECSFKTCSKNWEDLKHST
jgi:hypothetical protein